MSFGYQVLGFGSFPNRAGGYTVENAIWFDGLADRLTFDPSGASGTPDLYCISYWAKRSKLGGSDTNVISGGVNGYDSTIRYTNYSSYTDAIQFYANGGPDNLITNAAFSDPTAWHHVFARYDSNASGGSGDYMQLWVNGVRLTSFASSSMPSTGENSTLFDGNIIAVGGYNLSATQWFDGYLAEVAASDGQDHAATDFGEYDDNGVWVPIDPSGLTYGTNGFLLQFKQTGSSQNASGIGADTSGNNNHFAVEAGSPQTHQVTDSPTDDADNNTGNYATINPLNMDGGNTPVISNGNTTFTRNGSSSDNQQAYATQVAVGKKYWEFLITGNSNSFHAGWTAPGEVSGDEGAGPTGWDVEVYHLQMNAAGGGGPWPLTMIEGTAGSATATNTSLDSGEITTTPRLKFAIDTDAKKYWLGVVHGSYGGWLNTSGVGGQTFSEAAPTGTWTSDQRFFPYCFAHAQTGAGTFYFRDADWTDSAPSGFTAMSTANLPAPTVTPSEFFQVLDHTHDGSSSTFTLNWDPTVHDTMLMFKDQDDDSTNWYYSQTLYLGLDYPKTIPTKIAGSSQDTNFVSVSGTTITVGSTLPSSDYAVYCWRFGQISSRVSNSVAGAVQVASTTSVASHGGAGLCLYEGISGASNSVAKVVTHGMGSSGIGWFMWENWEQAHSPTYMHSSRANRNTHTMYLETAPGESNQFGYLFGGGTYPTGTTLSAGSQLMINGKDQVLWMFNEVDGFIKIGKYTGGGTSFPYVHTGFPPALIIIKRSDASSNWVWRDNLRSPFNPSDENLATDLSDNEDAAGGDIDFLANGFRPVQNEDTVNAGSGTYEYIAFASQPFGGDTVAQTKAR